MRPGSLIGPTIIAIGLVVAALAFAIVSTLLSSADGGTAARLARIEAAQIEAADETRRLRADLAAAQAQIEALRAELARRAMATPGPAPQPGTEGILTDPEIGDHTATEAPTEVMRLAEERFNQGITQAGNRFMLEMLGQPRDGYSQDCQAATNPRLKAALETREIGNFRTTMLRPALDSLERIFERLEATDPDLRAKLGTAGAFCARLIRGSTTGISNHSWGTAIDLTLEGVLDAFADGGTQFGLLIIAEYFNDEGWYWGATYGREDSMHFEVGAEQIRAWVGDGQI